MVDAQVTLITGGSSGIGAALARQLLERHHRVTITGRDQARLDRAVAELGAPEELLSLAGDAADHEAVRLAVETTITKFGRLDAIVANAGFATHDTVADGDPAAWRDMVLTNVLGPALLIKAALPAPTGDPRPDRSHRQRRRPRLQPRLRLWRHQVGRLRPG